MQTSKRRHVESPGICHRLLTARGLLAASAIVLITLIAYGPAYRAGYVWDDEHYVESNETLRSLDGLRRIWFEVGATDQYYPLVFTTFWVEYHLWGLHPVGYHVVNVLLHAAGAVLLLKVLTRMGLPWAILAALLFAVHPVQVESVAWVTERKNTLSGLLYFASMLAYLRWAGLGGPAIEKTAESATAHRLRTYVLALTLFLLALFSKTVTASLPAAILLIIWWQRGQIGWRDVAPLLPFFVAGVSAGLLTAYVERHHVGTKYVDWDLSTLDRILIAGRAVWFYLSKLLWPRNLTFSYPRWIVDAADWRQHLFPLGVVSAVLLLWFLRRRTGRGPLTAALFFIGTLAPALGFVDVYPMRFSFVADHFQYLACAGVFALCAGMVGSVSAARSARRVIAVAVLALLAILTWRQCRVYYDGETLWRDTLSKNPSSWMAHGNLAAIFARQGRLDEAIDHFHRGLTLKPDAPHVEFQLAAVLAASGRSEEAITRYRNVLSQEPAFQQAHTNLGNLLLQTGRPAEAEPHHRRAAELSPDDPLARHNLGMTLSRLGRNQEALDSFREAVRLDPSLSASHAQLGVLYTSRGQLEEAAAHLREAVRLDPGALMPRFNLAGLLLAEGAVDEAIVHLEAAARIDPSNRIVRGKLIAARAMLESRTTP